MAAGKPTIILLEDQADLRHLMADGLRDQRYPVVEAPTPAAALRAISSAGGHAVLVADRTLDGDATGGFDTADQALAAFPGLRAVFTSGAHPALHARALSDRERILPKPFALSQLVSLIKTLS